jgi:hypothetical protein
MRCDFTRCNLRMRSMITEGYERCRQRKLPSMPTRERKLNHSDDSDNGLRRETRATGMDGRRSMGSARKWRYGGRDHFWMFSSFSLLFFCSLDLGPVQMASARVFTTFGGSQVEVDFPRAPDPPKGLPEWYRSVAGLMISYEYVRGMIV